MQTVLIVFHLMVVVALVVIVLLQRSEGGALGIGGSSNPFMTGRGQANFLTRATAILGALFFITSLGLAFLAATSQPSKSMFDTPPRAAEDKKGLDLYDQLQKGQAGPAAPTPLTGEPPKTLIPQAPEAPHPPAP